MKLQTGLLAQILVDCREASRQASEARQSDLAALMGCLGSQTDDSFTTLQDQSDEFLALSDRMANWHTRLADDTRSISPDEKHGLLADLRQTLAAIRVATFDMGLYGRDGGMTDSEIADELGKYARLDCQLRAQILPPLKDKLGVIDTVAI